MIGKPLGFGGSGEEEREPRSCLIQRIARTKKATLAETKIESMVLRETTGMTLTNEIFGAHSKQVSAEMNAGNRVSATEYHVRNRSYLRRGDEGSEANIVPQKRLPL